MLEFIVVLINNLNNLSYLFNLDVVKSLNIFNNYEENEINKNNEF